MSQCPTSPLDLGQLERWLGIDEEEGQTENSHPHWLTRNETDLLVSKWNTSHRHALALAVAGAMRKMGWTEEQAMQVVREVARVAGDEEIDDRVRAVHDTFDRDKTDEAVAGWSVLTGDFGITPAELPSLRDHADRCDGDTGKKRNKAARLVELVDEQSLLRDQRDDAHTHLLIGDHRQVVRLRERRFREWLAARYYETLRDAVCDATINTAVGILCGKAQRATKVKLWNRVAVDQAGDFWLDLADEQWRAIRITAAGWQVIDHPPPLFRRANHQEPLPVPVPPGTGDATELLESVNLSGGDDELLFLVSTVVAFVPDIPQCILMLHGPQGSGKTCTARVRRYVVDPSMLPTVITKNEPAEVVQVLAKHFMPHVDNVSLLSDVMSDIYCQAATGGGLAKRTLYTDEDDHLFVFKRPIIMTGISPPSVAPDLLDRALLLRLDRIGEERRRDEQQLWDALARARPSILGGMLDALVRAIRIRPTLQLPRVTRMADFDRWGAAIAEAMGYGAAEFMRVRFANAERQTDEVIDGDPLAHALLLFARDMDAWTGTATNLLGELNQARENRGEPMPPGKDWPKSSVWLGRRLRTLATTLASRGVKVEQDKTAGQHSQRAWTVERV